MDKPQRLILSIIVMAEELESIVDSEKYEIDEEFTSKHKNILVCYKKEYLRGDLKIISCILTSAKDPLHKAFNPVGNEIAFLLAYIGATELKPFIILSVGYAGNSGLKQLKKGDVIISKGTGSYYLRSCVFEPYDPVIKGGYPVLDGSSIGKDLGFIPGIIGTSDSFLATDNGVSKEKGIDIIEMEFAAIARMAYYYKIQVLGLKIVSDGETEEEDRNLEFVESMKKLGAKINQSYTKLIIYIADHQESF